MSVQIHPTAIVEDGAELGENVVIGPYCLIGPNVKIGEGTQLKSHCVVEGHTTIGKNNEIHQFASIGVPPQDKSYQGEPTKTIIGDNNLIREGFQMHRATLKEEQITSLGDNNYLMSSVHIAHDCRLGNNITMASGCACAGHVHVGDFTQMGGQCGVTPFVTVGKGAFIGGASAIDRDVPHFCTALGNRIRLKGVNIIGLKRRGYNKQEVSDVVDFFRMMEASALSPKAFVDHPENLEEYAGNQVIAEIVEFISKSEIGLPPFMGE
jgi:UDP-N-acetylglucosamine acyltransferase